MYSKKSWSILLLIFLVCAFVTKSTAAVTVWQASTIYQTGDIVEPTSGNINGRLYKCTTGGMSGSNEPAWPKIKGETIVDGTVVWTTFRRGFGPYWCLTGGKTGCLDRTSQSDLYDGDVAIYHFEGTSSEYWYDADATDAENSPLIIRPDDYSTSGVWKQQDRLYLGSTYLHADTSGNLGIGTANPSTTFQIKGGEISLQDSESTDKLFRVVEASDEGYLYLLDNNVATVLIGAKGNSYLNGGNIGIGTDSPSEKLSVKNTVGDAYIEVIAIGSSSWQSGIKFYEHYGNYWGLKNKAAPGNYKFSINYNDTDLILINTAGQVGIGTSPTMDLDILRDAGQGDVQMQLVNTASAQPTADSRFFLKTELNSGDPEIRLSIGTVDWRFFLDNDESGIFKIKRQSADFLSINATGNIGIGTTGQSYKLEVNGVFSALEQTGDPAEPSEGQFIIWMSDGTGKGDDGDILIASKAGGVTKWKILFDHSAGNAW